MEIKQNPFSLYDFLGYFIPGALFLMGLMAIPYLPDPPSLLEGLNKSPFLTQAGFYFPFIIFAYLAGHILSFISSVTLENYSVWKVGYPSKFLMGVKAKEYFEIGEYPKARKAIRFFVGAFLLPITLFDFLGNLIHIKELLYARPLDPILTKLIKGKLTKLSKKHSGLTSKDIQNKDSDLFRFAYHYAVGHSQNHLLKMQNYVALYGFARTITMVMVLWFWIVPVVSFIKCFPFWNSLLATAILSALSFISFLNFMKFYRRFSLEVLMAISTVI